LPNTITRTTRVLTYVIVNIQQMVFSLLLIDIFAVTHCFLLESKKASVTAITNICDLR